MACGCSEVEVEPIIDINVDTIAEADINTTTLDDIPIKQEMEIELSVNQWTLVSDAVMIKDISGQEPQWFIDMFDRLLQDNEWLFGSFEGIYGSINALDDGFTYLVSTSDNHAQSIVALKASTEHNAAAIVKVDYVKVTELEAKAISESTITAWMDGGASQAWFSTKVDATARSTSANTEALELLFAEVDGISASVGFTRKAYVKKLNNQYWWNSSITGQTPIKDTIPPTPQHPCLSVDDPDYTSDCCSDCSTPSPYEYDEFDSPRWLYDAGAYAQLKVNANGVIGGLTMKTNGETSRFRIFADEFTIAGDDFGDPGSKDHYVFKVDTTKTPARIYMIADVYFGDFDDQTGDYYLKDIISDGTFDPTEKAAVEKVFYDVKQDYDRLMAITNIGAPYQELYNSNSRLLFNDAFLFLKNALCGYGVPRTHIGSGIDENCNGAAANSTIYEVSIFDGENRDQFNGYFNQFYTARAEMDAAITSLVKNIADNSIKILDDIFADGKLSVADKESLRDLREIWFNDYIEERIVSDDLGLDCVTWPDSPVGFEPKSLQAAQYRTWSRYYWSLFGQASCERYEIVPDTPVDIADIPLCLNDGGTCTPPNPACPPIAFSTGNVLPGFLTQVNCTVYDIDTPIETIVAEEHIARIKNSMQFTIDRKMELMKSHLDGVVDFSEITIGSKDPVTGSGATIIKGGEITTDVVGDEDFIATYETASIDGTGIDFRPSVNKIQFHRDRVASPACNFRVDSEADGTFHGICDDANQSNLRGLLIEGAAGAFTTLVTGALSIFAEGLNHEVRNKIVKYSEKDIVIANGIDDVEYTPAVRFYAPQNAITTADVGNARIRSFQESVFTIIGSGAYQTYGGEDHYSEAGITIEYNIDNTEWKEVENQSQKSTTGQTVVLLAPFCVEFVDFRMRVDMKSVDFKHIAKTMVMTVFLSNI